MESRSFGAAYGPSMTGSFKSSPNFNQIVRQSEYDGLQSNYNSNPIDYAYDHSENLMQNYLLTTNPASGLTIVYGTFFDKLSRGGADIDINYVHDEDTR